MRDDLDLATAGGLLRDGGMVAYPTEGVWGLGCDPFQPAALQRLLALKQRPVAKGLILIASSLEQLAPLIDLDSLSASQRDAVLATWPGAATWTVPCTPAAPRDLRGDHDTLAVRVTAHPVAAALCREFGGPLVSTSANLAGEPAVRRREDLDPRVIAGCDGVLSGETGGLLQPTPIRDARTGDTLRA